MFETGFIWVGATRPLPTDERAWKLHGECKSTELAFVILMQ